MGVAEMTTGAFLGGYNDGYLLLFVKSQHFGRAELHADVAAFAPLGENKNLPARAFAVSASRCFRCIQLCFCSHFFLFCRSDSVKDLEQPGETANHNSKIFSHKSDPVIPNLNYLQIPILLET
jgi:hypothetical protein